MREVSLGAMKNTIGHATRATGGGWRRESVAKVNSRAHGKAPILGRAISMLHHGSGGVRERSPLTFHFGELVVCIRGRELSSETQ